MKFWRNHIKEVAIITGVILLALLVMDYNTRLEKLNRLNEKALSVRVEATQVVQTQLALETQIAAATSAQVTEGEARTHGEIQEGDQLIVPLPALGNLPVETSAPEPMPERLMKWQIWHALFFEH